MVSMTASGEMPRSAQIWFKAAVNSVRADLGRLAKLAIG